MPARMLLLGNEAVGQAAVEAGALFVAGYPGTPSSEVIPYFKKNKDGQSRAEWSVNEKVALETCAGVSYSGCRCMAVMKHVGLNVAADPFMTLAYTGVRGGLVVVSADDPGLHSSQNGQDTRHFADAAHVLCLEPMDPQESLKMTREAFRLSEKLDVPILVRTMTRVAHTAGPVETANAQKPWKAGFSKDVGKFVMVPANSRPAQQRVVEKQGKIREYVESAEFNSLQTVKDSKTGIIAAGSMSLYAREYGGGKNILKVSTWPAPKKKIHDFCKGLDEVIVLEQGDPLLEEMAACIHPNVKGKLTGHLPPYGELLAEHVMAALKVGKPESAKAPTNLVVPRPPVFCPGCPHRGTFMELARRGYDAAPGDIGCYTLGYSEPFNVLDTCHCMGSGVNHAAGMKYAGAENVYALIGDSTFIHSGIAGLINAVHNKSDFTLIIFDNDTTAMTGHQPTAATDRSINLERLCIACGAAKVVSYNPLDIKGTSKAFDEVQAEEGVRVLIAKSPCARITREKKPPKEVDPKKCTSCGQCLKTGCAALRVEDGKTVIDGRLCVGCGLCVQTCPVQAIGGQLK